MTPDTVCLMLRPPSAEHIASDELEQYVLQGTGDATDTERIEAHLSSCTTCRGSFEEEKLYIEVMRAALSAFHGGKSFPKGEGA